MNLKCTDILAVNETGLDDTISSGEVSRFISGILSIMNVYLISTGKPRVDWH